MKKLHLIFALCLALCVLTACAQAPLSGDTQPSPSFSCSCPTTEPQPSDPPPWSHDAALANLLEEINRSGEYLPDPNGGTPVPPGTLVDVLRIPQPSGNRIGETVPIILAKGQQKVPFYYICSEDGEERLAVFIGAEKLPMLVVFETELGGIKSLLSHIQSETVFHGRILSMTNISWEEGNVYAVNLCSYAEDIPADEMLTADTDLVAGECIGIVGTTGIGDVQIVKGGQYPTASKALKEDIEWMRDIFKRYFSPAVSEDLSLTMRTAFAQLQNDGVKIEELSVRYYGAYGANHVGFIDGPYSYTEALWQETLLGLEFHYTCGQKLYVYNDGRMLALGEAVENGWFTQEELQQLHTNYTIRKWFAG